MGAQIIDGLLIRDHAGALFVTQCRQTFNGLEAAIVIGDHQHMAIKLMFKEIEDALLFHQALDEIEVGFPVLGTILPRWITPSQIKAHILALDIGLFQYLLEDVRHGSLLEDAQVAAILQKRQFGHQPYPVQGITVAAFPLLQVLNLAMQILGMTFIKQGQQAVLANQGFLFESGVFTG